MTTEQKKKDAVREFNRLVPMLNGFAKAFTGNKNIRVVAHERTQTDGKTIMIRPPLALAVRTPHDRRYCDHRDTGYQQICQQCGTREDVMSKLYHEMAHIMFNSLADISPSVIQQTTMKVLRSWGDDEFTEYASDKISNYIRRTNTLTAQGIAHAVSPYLGFIDMALEDYRIDRASYVIRSGIEIMRFAGTERILDDGVENDDGENLFWIDRKENVQMSVAMLCDLHGHDLEGRFQPEIIEALHDERLSEILVEMDNAENVIQSYECALSALMRLRELGFFLTQEEPDPQQGGGEGDEPVKYEFGMGEPDEMGEALGQITGHEEAEEADAEYTQADIEDLKKIISQTKFFDKSSSEVVLVREYTNGEGSAWNNDAAYGEAYGMNCDLSIPESVVGKSVLEARRAFTENKLNHMERNRKSGRINKSALGKRAWGNDPRLFQKKNVPGKRDYEVVIGLDVSGSTAGKDIVRIKRAAAALAEVCKRSGVKFSIFAHSCDTINTDGTIGWDWSKTQNGLTLDIYKIKSVDEPWDNKHIDLFNQIGSADGNVDGHTLEYYRKVCDKSTATDKVIMYFTDGAMPAANYDEELTILQREIATCKQKGYTLLGVGIGTDSPKAHGLDTVQVDGDEDITKVVRHLAKVLTR